MADGDVSVGGEDHEEEGAGDLVDRGRGEVDLAHRRPERPLPHEHGHYEEGDPNKEALVRHRQVQDVRVCHLNNVSATVQRQKELFITVCILEKRSTT